MYIVTLIFIAILVYTTLEELNLSTDIIQGGFVMLEQYLPYLILIGIVFALFKGFTASGPGNNGGGGGGNSNNRSRGGGNSGRGRNGGN